MQVIVVLTNNMVPPSNNVNMEVQAFWICILCATTHDKPYDVAPNFNATVDVVSHCSLGVLWLWCLDYILVCFETLSLGTTIVMINLGRR